MDNIIDENIEEAFTEEETVSRVYALLDERNLVIRLEGEYTLPADLTGWMLIEEGKPCDRLNLAQSLYLPKPLYEDRGIPRYKYIQDVEIVERTQAEIDADCVEPIPQPTQFDRIEAQTLYTALMTNTLIN